MNKLVLLRHGESVWNLENRFTGWTDVDLSTRGLEEAALAGRLLKEHGYLFERAFTSVLKRAIRTLWIVLDNLDQMWLPTELSWRLVSGTTELYRASTRPRWGRTSPPVAPEPCRPATRVRKIRSAFPRSRTKIFWNSRE